MAVQLKGMKRGEYATHLIAADFYLFYGISKLESIMDTVERIQGYIRGDKVYLATLVKMMARLWRSLPPESARTRASAPWHADRDFRQAVHPGHQHADSPGPVGNPGGIFT